jgi:hypothetical protein
MPSTVIKRFDYRAETRELEGCSSPAAATSIPTSRQAQSRTFAPPSPRACISIAISVTAILIANWWIELGECLEQGLTACENKEDYGLLARFPS